MAPSTDILIGDSDRQYVLLRPLSRSHPGLFDRRDGNWIDCELEIAAGGFRGTFHANLRSEDFQTFLEEAQGLSRMPDGTATFSTMEGQISLSLTGGGDEHVRVHGEALDTAGIGNRLTFGFEIDRTSLTGICRSLEYLLAAFPVIGIPD